MKREKPKPYSLEEKLIIEREFFAGQSHFQIAHLLKRPVKGIAKEIKKYSFVDDEGNVRYSVEKSEEAKKYKYTSLLRKFTEEEKGIIDEMVSENYSISTIRRKIFCSYTTLKNYIYTNYPSYESPGFRSINQRIQNLENQIEIILEILEKIKP